MATRCAAQAESAGREFFFDHFTAADAYFFWCVRRAGQLEVDLSRFKNCMAHFERIQKRPGAQKLPTFENSVQDQFAKAAQESSKARRRPQHLIDP
jgi:glutathione S-transferase